ncbi:MAG: hypothetical protein QOF78_711 [Phycisphaerales bacterium]|jgi:uncharacterized membrane protein YeaQ/YmgE (transglycosylase-associated protein family)|nr:hypothetical protein [Phycisphaerales bacterium]MEA2735105.1 hypothetical protein [Humisphaera sp.]
MIFGIIGWVVVGVLIGFIVSKAFDLHGDDPRLGIAVAGGGAVFAAVLYTIISGAGVSAFNVWSLLFAAIGAGVAVAVWHGVRARYVSRVTYSRRRSY